MQVEIGDVWNGITPKNVTFEVNMPVLSNWRFATIALLIFFLYLPGAAAAEQIRFNWAVLHDTEEGPKALDFSTPPNVAQNSTLQLYVQAENTAYVYIFLQDSSNTISPLFPVSENYYYRTPPGEAIRIPAGKDRFAVVPPPGQEKIYLLASAKRLVELESLLEECLRAPGDVNSQARLFREIRLLRRQHSDLTQVTEKGMPVSGTTRRLDTSRGAEKQDDFEVTQVVAKDFYSKILRLNHD